MKIAIVENEQADYQKLSDLINQYLSKETEGKNIPFSIDYYTNGYDFLESKDVYQVVFLDIEMPGINGMETAIKLRENNLDCLIVFVTNMSQYAIDGYKVNAIDFCLKPINYPDVKLVMDKIVKRLEVAQESYIVVKHEGDMLKIRQSDIETIEMDKHDAIIAYYKGDELKTVSFRSSMKEILNKVSDPYLIPASSGSLLNLVYLDSFNNANLIAKMKSGKTVFISRSHKRDFLIKLSEA